jgi:metal-responsive CopG/Arc/MetJ family transcriptional regulator
MKNRVIRVPDVLWDEAQAVATERGENLSEILRDALRRYVGENR